MYLKKLELSGFKSFAKPTRLEFPHPIVGVVGPNGSGKSNIAEGFRWVLGEQSIKSLRGKKGEDLIFNGSQSAPRLGKASVSLFFDNRKKIFPIDYDEIKITRKVFRDGINDYLINDSKVRHKDVVEFLSKIGIGSSNHHTISQGESDRILNASLKERRQMIEDALGLKIYQIKKLEAERKLEKTKENINQVESLRKEIQPHLRFLKKQAEKAQTVSSLREDLKKYYSEYLSNEGKFISLEEEKIESGKDKIKNELAKIYPVGKSEDSHIAKIKNRIKESSGKIDKKESETEELRSEIKTAERELGRLEGMSEAMRSKEVGGEKNSVSSKIVEDFLKVLDHHIDRGLGFFSAEEIKRVLGEMSKSIREFSDRISSGVKIAPLQMDEIEKKKKDTQDFLEKINKKEKEMAGQIDGLKKEIEDSERKLHELEKEEYQAAGKIKELNISLENIKIKEDNLRIQKEELKREIQEAKALVNYEGELLKDEFELEKWIAERGKLRREIERLKIRIEDSGAISGEVLKEYEEVKKRDEFFETELGDLNKSLESLEGLLDELEEKIDNDFKSGIEKINKEFQSFFEEMFGGGKAELERITPPKRSKKDPALDEIEAEEGPEEGVEVKVSLPKKRISSLDMLSGGERALTSIALLFAMSQVNPPPFLVLDETDAALDEANSQKYGSMLQNLSKKTQLVLITHNRETMRQAGILYGVTMGSDSISRLLSIKFTDAEQYTSR